MNSDVNFTVLAGIRSPTECILSIHFLREYLKKTLAVHRIIYKLKESEIIK